MNPISRTVPQRNWGGSQVLDLELVSFFHCWMDTLGLLHPRSRESFAIMQTIYFLEVLIYAGRQGKLDQEHLNTVYSVAIAVREKIWKKKL